MRSAALGYIPPCPSRRLNLNTKTQRAQDATNEKKTALVGARSESVIPRNVSAIRDGPISRMAINAINGHWGSNDILSMLSDLCKMKQR